MKAFTIFCDDIRLENSGKHLLIGVYTSKLVVPELPWNATLATWVSLSGLGSGTHSIQFIVEYVTADSTRVIGDVSSELTIEQPDVQTILSPTGLAVPIDAEGFIRLLVKIDGAEGVDAGRLKVGLYQEAGSGVQA